MLKKILGAVGAMGGASGLGATAAAQPYELPLFPLGTVLFPDGILPLRIFEQRYMDMAKACLKNQAPFGVCLIREGGEVGAPAVPESVGTLARIEDWDMEQLGVLQVRTSGGGRFRVLDTRVHDNGLIIGTVENIEDDAPTQGDEFLACRNFLSLVLAKIGSDRHHGEARMDDPSWVSFRITEILPISPRIKQKMLELTDARMRLEVVHRVLKDQRLVT
ncbi:MAG: LON peptidase substrate-binding domain-containing protein [Burkholderiales bacterium]|nr:LON peptidase substrate-binding domain-containing protein [Burkholderiales bacterium]